ncbi:MAG: 50S ribosomal protein L1 [Caldilineae bacterium]|nr:50S ribosomal protein L1 [Chloroflexota bacterium]MCB9177679.1 50S ribosomal protein L1 [Caldilineae bacterium]
MAQIGKKRKAAVERVDRSRNYAPVEAVGLVKDVAYAKFDESVELHMRLGVDPRHADQQVRGVMALPHGTGRDVRILVFAEGDAARAAEAAGADHVGGDELAEKIRGGWLEFDSVIATQPMMRVVGRLGPVLGPRGLMPSPKAGTVVGEADVADVVRETKAGRMEFRIDKTANLHIPFGKVSFEQDKLIENLAAAIDAVVRAKPSGAKGNYIQSVTIASTMGPGIRLDLPAALAMAR